MRTGDLLFIMLIGAIVGTGFGIFIASFGHPTPDQIYGCTIAQQTPSGECP